MKTYTESELRETLRVASLGATLETHTRSKRRVLAPILAAAAAAAIVIPIGLVRLGDDTNSSLQARDHASVQPLSRTPTHSTGDEVTLQEITDLTGYEFKQPAPGDTPESPRSRPSPSQTQTTVSGPSWSELSISRQAIRRAKSIRHGSSCGW
jgi:hypothetical protein